MLRITYISAESYKLSSEDLLSILGKCNENNPRLGLTGMLIYGNGTFIQSIEGKEEIVKNMISKISSDARHKDFKVLSEEITEQRLYDEFNMGFERLTEHSLSDIVIQRNYQTFHRLVFLREFIKNKTHVALNLTDYDITCPTAL